MGCCNSNSAFRFKGYVVDVYPPEEDGEPNLDALGKLKAYVSKNPERIPRVCRKVNKLTTAHLEKSKVNNARIGVLIIHDLIEDSAAVDYFVPHTVDMVMMLQGHEDEDLRISACALVAILTYKIGDKPLYEPSRRSLASVQAEIISFLDKMATDGMGTNEVLALHCRYAALVSLGNLFRCLRSSLVDSVTAITNTTLENLHDEMRRHSASGNDSGNTPYSPAGRDSSMTSDAFSYLSECPLLTGDEQKFKHQIDELRSVELPNQNASQKDAAYHNACIALLMSLATSCGNATVGDFISDICRFMDSSGGWFTERMPEDTFKAVAIALQRKQQLGFSVCQKLLDLVVEHPSDKKLEAILRVCTSVLTVLPLNGVRPMLCMDAFSTVLRSPSHRDGVYSGVILAVEAVAKRTVEQGNVGQLLRVGLELCQSVNRTQHNVSVCVGLDALAAAAPCLATLSLAEKIKLKMVSTLRPFLILNSREEIHIKQKAATCLAAYLVGRSITPNPATIPGIGGSILPEELEFITSWLQSIVLSEDTFLTPNLVLESVNIVYGLLKVGGYSILPWILDTMLFDVQSRLQTIENENDHPSEKSGSQWTLMWHLFSLGVVRAIGEVLQIKELVEFSVDILKRRKGPDAGEVPQCFVPRFDNCQSQKQVVGLRVAAGFEDVVYTRRTAESDGSAPAVNYTISRRTVATYLFQSGNMTQLMDAYQSDTDGALRAALEGGHHGISNDGSDVTDSPAAASLNGALLRASSIRGGIDSSSGVSPLAGTRGATPIDGMNSRALPSVNSMADIDLGSSSQDAFLFIGGGFGFDSIPDFKETPEDQLHVVAGPPRRSKTDDTVSFTMPTVQEEFRKDLPPPMDLINAEVRMPEQLFTKLLKMKSSTEPLPSSMTSRLSATRRSDSVTSFKTGTSMLTSGPHVNLSITGRRAKALRTPGADVSGLPSSSVVPATPSEVDSSHMSIGFQNTNDEDVLNGTVSELGGTLGEFDLF